MNSIQQIKFDEALATKPYLRPLVDRLLSVGGSYAVIWNSDLTTSEGFIHILLAFGRAQSGKYARLRRMKPNRCHENAETLGIRYPKRYMREIGFAMVNDGMWRPHSWCWDVKENRIVDTTGVCNLYFGVTYFITPEERTDYARRSASTAP